MTKNNSSDSPIPFGAELSNITAVEIDITPDNYQRLADVGTEIADLLAKKLKNSKEAQTCLVLSLETLTATIKLNGHHVNFKNELNSNGN